MVQTRNQLQAAGLTPGPALGSKATRTAARTTTRPQAAKKVAPPIKTTAHPLAGKKRLLSAAVLASNKRKVLEIEDSAPEPDGSSPLPSATVLKATATRQVQIVGPRKTVQIAVTPPSAKNTALPTKPTALKKRKVLEIAVSESESESESDAKTPAPRAKIRKTEGKAWTAKPGKTGIFASTPVVLKKGALPAKPATAKKRKVPGSEESESEAPTPTSPAKIPKPVKKVQVSKPGSSTKKFTEQASKHEYTTDELHTPTKKASSSRQPKAAPKKQQPKKLVLSDDDSSKGYVSDSVSDWSKYESEFDRSDADDGPFEPAGQPAQPSGQSPQDEAEGGDDGRNGADEGDIEWPEEEDASFDVSPIRSNPGGRGGDDPSSNDSSSGGSSDSSVLDLQSTRNIMQVDDLITLVGEHLEQEYDYASLFNLRCTNRQCWRAAKNSFFDSFEHFTVVLAPAFLDWAPKLLQDQAIADRIKLVSFDAPPRGHGYGKSNQEKKILKNGLLQVLSLLNNVKTVEFARLQKLHPKMSSRDKLWRKEGEMDFYYRILLDTVGRWPSPIKRITNQRRADDVQVWEYDEANTLDLGSMPLDCFVNHQQTPTANFWFTRFWALETAELDVNHRGHQLTSEANTFILCGLKNASNISLDHVSRDDLKLHNFVTDLANAYRANIPHLCNIQFLTVTGTLVTTYKFYNLLKILGPRLVGVDLLLANLTLPDVKFSFVAGTKVFLKHWIGKKGQFPHLQDFKLEVLWKKKRRFDERPLNRTVWQMRDRRDMVRPSRRWKAFWTRLQRELENLNDQINDGETSSEEVSEADIEPSLAAESESA